MSCTTPGEGMVGPSLDTAVRTYALRIARKCWFQARLRQDDHPVLLAELHLVEMAGSALREQFLASFPESEMKAARSGIEARIRLIARARIQSLTDDDEILKGVFKIFEEEDLSRLFTFLH